MAHDQGRASLFLSTTLFYFIFLSLAAQLAFASHHHWHPRGLGHNHAHLHHDRALASAASNANSSQPTLPVGGEVASLVDQAVRDLTFKYNSSDDSMQQLLEAAEKIKTALSQPSSVNVNHARAAEHLAPFAARQVSNGTANASPSANNQTVDDARDVIRRAQQEASARNLERFQHPRLNVYYTGGDAGNPHAKKRALEADLLPINATLASAAALVAEADAAASGGFRSIAEEYLAGHKQRRTTTEEGLVKRADSFWMENIEHTGTFPFGGSDNNGYKVFRNVKDYGATGDGKTDDTAAINRAMAEGNRCGANCGSSSVKGAILYFPSGTYLISTPIEAYYNTQMIGDIHALPVLLAAPSFVGLGVVSSDKYTGGSGGADQWFINQNNFMRQMRNFAIDTSQANMIGIAGMHWQVAQATSIQNVFFFGSNDTAKEHIGVFAENGSGGFMSDLTFLGSGYGLRCGNQQFTTRNLRFINNVVAIDMLWDWGWTWKSLDIMGAAIGIQVAGEYMGGSIMVLDSRFDHVGMAVSVKTPKGSTDAQHFSITMDNVIFDTVTVGISDVTTGARLEGGSRPIDSWTMGRVYDDANPTGTYQAGAPLSTVRPRTEGLMGGANKGYFERSKPQYENLNANDFLSAKVAAKGDGTTDDTVALNLILSVAVRLRRPVYMPAGSYIVTDTVDIAPGTQLVGECWAQIVAKGARFEDMNSPHIMVRVGKTGDVGTVEIQDLIFTTQGSTAGAVLMEWNIAASGPGSAGMWDSHFRVGGALGSNLQAAHCPKLSGSVNNNCVAGSMLLHVTQSSSAYLENVWAWVADHDLDSGPAQTQIDIYVARGILIESTQPTWLYGTASEHTVFYQYQLSNAENVFMGMIQTESPYYLPNPQAPAPFGSAVGKFPDDPTFEDCDAANSHCKASWGLRTVSATNVHVLGAGLYNWFQAYTQSCVDSQDCQQRVVQFVDSPGIWLYNLFTIGTVEMVSNTGSAIMAKDNTNMDSHPFTSTVNAYLLDSYDSEMGDDDDQMPECNGDYASVADVAAYKANIDERCIDKYLVDAQAKMMDGALEKYQHAITDGYDAKFKIYANHIKQLVPAQIVNYMHSAQRSGFWTCSQKMIRKCCSECSGAWGICDGCSNVAGCQSGPYMQKVDCPTSVPDGVFTSDPNVPELQYTLTNEDGFFADLQNNYGIARDWVKFGKHMVYLHPHCEYDPNPNQCIQDKSIFWTGFPMPDDIVVSDPKSLISDNAANTAALSAAMATNNFWADWAGTFATHTDIADSTALPAFMLVAAVESMDKVVEKANEITAEERKTDILMFVTGLLMMIPAAGLALEVAGMTAIRNAILLVGDLGDAALTLFSIVDNHGQSALFDIFGYLFGRLGALKGKVGDDAAFTSAAAIKRGMSEEDLTKIAPIKENLDRVKTARGSACSI